MDQKPRNKPADTAIISIAQIIELGSPKRIINAYRFAAEIHDGHFRNSGDPYLLHLTETANSLLLWLNLKKLTKSLEDIIIAGLLHDSVEYEKTTLKKIGRRFGSSVEKLVTGVSDLRSHKSKLADMKNLRFIAEKGYMDPRVFVIKLADRLHNMRTHDTLQKDKQVAKAQETMDVYVPLAESMGMWEVKKELEDICFSFVKPSLFAKIKKTFVNDPRTDKKFQDKIRKKLQNLLQKSSIKAAVAVNENGLWTIYKKRENEINSGNESRDGLSHISDAISFSIITENENILNLYKILGILHTSGEFGQFVDTKEIDDYISKPQPNKFSALQTTLNMKEGKTEILITSQKRAEFNKKGIVELIRNGKDLNEYKRSIIFDEEKNAWFLPTSATYYDYVYTTGVGKNAKEVLVDGQKIRLNERVKNGSVVKVVFAKNKNRKIDARILKYCLPQTKMTIEKEMNLEEREKLVKKGKKLIEKVLRPRGLLSLSDSKSGLLAVLNTLYIKDSYDLYYKIAAGSISLAKISEILDKYAITKENLGLSTLRISGKNKPGILADVAMLIKNLGGNIYNISSSRPLVKNEDSYKIRLLFMGIESKDVEALEKRLKKDNSIKKFELV